MPAEQLSATSMFWLRMAQDRSFSSEGIPMVLALMRPDGPRPPETSQAVRADGEHIGKVLTLMRQELFSSQRDGDMGCLISTLQATSAATSGLAAPEVSTP